MTTPALDTGEVASSPHPSRQQPAVVAHYRAVEQVLLRHLRHREVHGVGAAPESVADAPARRLLIEHLVRPVTQHSVLPVTEHSVRLSIGDPADLHDAVRSGITGFALPALTGPGMLPLHVRPGPGSGIDTVATAALSLLESIAADGLQACALTDGGEGIFVFGVGAELAAPPARNDRERAAARAAPGEEEGTGPQSAASYAAALAAAAPEIATTDPSDTDGRALVLPIRPGAAVPAPYSLVRMPAGFEVVAPLALDDVAAATAGMPLDIEPQDMAARLATRGDLAAMLAAPDRRAP